MAVTVEQKNYNFVYNYKIMAINYRNGYIRAISARQLSVSREKLFEWNRILCSVITAQNKSKTFFMPEIQRTLKKIDFRKLSIMMILTQLLKKKANTGSGNW